MKVLFVLALAVAQALGASISNLPAKNGIEISHMPANLPSGIEISHLPADLPSGIEISHLPADLPNGIEISHLPADLPSGIEIGHLPADLPSGIEIGHLPAELPNGIEIGHLPADLPNGIEIGHLPAELPNGIEIGHLPAVLPEAESTPSCVKYVRQLLEEVLAQLPGAQQPVERPNPVLPEQEEAASPIEDQDACTKCFQKLQLLIEKANSRNSNILTF
ncbi:uncharacterized protein LOC126740519 isoform X5 [Anthonomus grandis grandis]|uniref:uncharacterized protein LOC126740519 isoform X5 n=1 Tax=Anthonomus grandis grandis TaxID=2921223 RepID=UPI002164FA46|nr:uncharacterized protein LOC126740519 isoform X5 [Anthonomus grandis grandis]